MRVRRPAVLAILAAAVLAALLATAGPALGSGWYHSGTLVRDQAGGLRLPQGVAALANGGVAVADPLAARVSIYDATGAPVRDLSTDAMRQVVPAPTDVAEAADGTLWVVSRLTGRLAQLDELTGAVLTDVAVDADPVGIDIGPNGDILVVGDASPSVRRYDSTGASLGTLASFGFLPGDVCAPVDVAAAADGTTWVTDPALSRVQHLDTDGTYLGEIYVSNPLGVDVAPDGSLLVSSADSPEIQHVQDDGTPLGTIGVAGSGVGERLATTYVALDPSGMLLASDPVLRRVVRYTAAGATDATLGAAPDLSVFRAPSTVVDAGAGARWVVDSSNEGLFHDTGGGAWGKLSGSFGAALHPLGAQRRVAASDGADGVWFGDSGDDVLEHVDGTGVSVATVGGHGAAAGLVDGLAAIAPGPAGGVYVVDLNTGRLQELDATGSQVRAWGGVGSADGQFTNPARIAVDASGDVWVLDLDGRVQRFSAAGVHEETYTVPAQVQHAGLELEAGFDVRDDGTAFAVSDPAAGSIRRYAATGGAELDSLLRSTAGAPVGPSGIELTGTTGLAVTDALTGELSTWLLDSADPVASVAVDTSGSHQVTFTVTASDADSGLAPAAYSFDGGATWGASPVDTAAGLDWNANVARSIRVRDAAGNTTSLAASATWGVDLDPPTVAVSTVRGDHSVTFGVVAMDAISGLDAAAYSFDGGATWVSADHEDVTGMGWNDVATRTVLVRDDAGNVSAPQTRSDSWAVDTDPPSVTAGTTGGDHAVSFDVTAGDAGSGLAPDAYSYDGGRTWTSAASDVETGMGWNDIATRTVVVRDAAGNEAEPQPLVASWGIDVDQPVASVQTGSGAHSVRFTATASDATSGLADEPFSFDGGQSWTSASELVVTDLDWNVPVERTVVVRDAAGNVSEPVTASTMWRVDSTPPTLDRTIRVLPDRLNGRHPFVPFVVRDGGSGLSSITATFRGRTVPLRYGRIDARALPEGAGTLVVRARDRVGLEMTYTRRLVVDRTAPQQRPAARYTFDATLQVAGTDALTGVVRATRLRGLRLGANTRAALLEDGAGNRRRVAVHVERRLSLSEPWRNAGIEVARGQEDTEAFTQLVFGFHSDAAPGRWFAGSGRSPRLVREVQWRLQTFGFLSRSHALSGVLDVPTLAGVRDFQRSVGLPAIGTVGPRTRSALDARLLAER